MYDCLRSQDTQACTEMQNCAYLFIYMPQQYLIPYRSQRAAFLYISIINNIIVFSYNILYKNSMESFRTRTNTVNMNTRWDFCRRSIVSLWYPQQSRLLALRGCEGRGRRKGRAWGYVFVMCWVTCEVSRHLRGTARTCVRNYEIMPLQVRGCYPWDVLHSYLWPS